MEQPRPLSIPVILGTARQGRMSAHAARWIAGYVGARPGVETTLIDIASLALPNQDAGEQIKDPGISKIIAACDALIIVSPEYNHSFPGLLKHMLDAYLKEYIHKAVGVVGVSAGSFGGARGIQNLLPVLREVGLVTIFWDVYIGDVAQAFDAGGRLLDRGLPRRTDKFLDELIWMAKTLRYGREHIALA